MNTVIRVLFVDDDLFTMEGYIEELRERGCVVVLAHSVADALDQWRANEFDLVVLDLLLPPGDGYSVTDAEMRDEWLGTRVRDVIRATPSGIPIIFLTNFPKGATRKIVLGVQEFLLVKPDFPPAAFADLLVEVCSADAAAAM